MVSPILYVDLHPQFKKLLLHVCMNHMYVSQRTTCSVIWFSFDLNVACTGLQGWRASKYLYPPCHCASPQCLQWVIRIRWEHVSGAQINVPGDDRAASTETCWHLSCIISRVLKHTVFFSPLVYRHIILISLIIQVTLCSRTVVTG